MIRCKVDKGRLGHLMSQQEKVLQLQQEPLVRQVDKHQLPLLLGESLRSGSSL
jgi:hypothetical protein